MHRALFAILLCAVPAYAHHGRDFLVVETPALPHPGDHYVVTSEMWTHSTFTTEPSILIGISERVAAELHLHIVKAPGESLHVEALAPVLHMRLGSTGAWNFAATAEYEIGRGEESDATVLRFIGARDVGRGEFVVNAGGELSGRDGRLVYAAGYRPDTEARASWGIEATGIACHGEEQQAIFGVYLQPAQRFTFKVGTGVGLGNGRPAGVFRTGLVWRF